MTSSALSVSTAPAAEPARGGTTSLWMATATMPPLEPMLEDVQADVCVVGAGIAGLTTAYLLAAEGKSVVVLDDGPIGGGETGRSSAHLSTLLDRRYAEITRLHGDARTALIADSHRRAIAEIAAIVEREAIACDFVRRDGYLFAGTFQYPADLEEERKAAHAAGLAVEWVARAPLASFDTGRCLRFAGQAQFHPLRYLAGLAQAIARTGGRLFAGHASRILGGSQAFVETASGFVVSADAVVVATNSPVNDRLTIHSKQGAYRSYVLAAPVPVGQVSPALYWDTSEPFHYARLQPHDARHDLLIVGGEDHHTGQSNDAEARFTHLAEWATERFGALGPIAHRWSGQTLSSIDGLAFIGRNPGDEPNVFVATGDSGNGLTHGTIAGMLIRDLVIGRSNPWEAAYDPGRITPLAAGSFTKEGLTVAAGYARWLAPGARVASVDDIAPGHGAVVRRGLRMIAAFRDEHGRLSECSAICPHLGGLVAWNDGEQSWDCPCHGSRFDARGRVLNGPANSDLPEPS